MAIILPRQRTFGEVLGSGLGAGLGTGMQELAKYKMGQMQQQELAKKLSPLFEAEGASPELASILGQASPQIQQQWLKNAVQQKQLGPLYDQLSNLLKGDQSIGGSISPQISQEIDSQSQYQEFPQKQMMPTSQELAREIVSGEETIKSLREGFPLPFRGIQMPEKDKAFSIREKEMHPSDRPLSQDEILQLSAAISSKDPKAMGKSVRDIYKERRREEAIEKKLSAEEKRRKEEREFEMYKLSGPQRKELRDNAKRARDDLHDLNRMTKLQEEMQLDTPGYVEFLKRSGFDIPALMNPGSQEFNKLRQSFLRNMKTYFGARISNQEMEQFLKGIPDLSQSPEGRKRVLAGMKRIARGAITYNDAYNEVLKENNWKLPLYWEEMVEDKVKPKMNKIAEMFKRDLSRPVPPSHPRLVTALQSAAGSLLGAPGKVLGKIGSIGSGSDIATAALL